MSDFQLAKLWLVDLLGLTKDAVHVYFGLAVFLIAAAIFRLPLRDWRPLAAVLAAAIAGELWDLLDTHLAGDTLRWDKSWHDLWNTLFWPAVLFVLARYTKVLRR